MKEKQKNITCKAAQKKKDKIKRMKELAQKYPIVGILNLENLPCAQLQQMRKKLKGQVEMFMTRKKLMSRALEETGLKNIEKLKEYMGGVPALVFTKENPFKIFKIIKQNKSSAPAKPVQKAPRDLIIPAGPTPFAPGPIISDFAAVGVIAGVEGGKVAVKKEAIVAREGQEINAKVAGILSKLNIMPMEIGLDLVAIYENGTIYDKKILNVDEEQFKQDLCSAAAHAMNLAVEAGIFTKETTKLMIEKAARQAYVLADEAEIMTKETIPKILAKAEAQAAAINKEN